MCNVKKWHHGVPSDEQYEMAKKELNNELEILLNRKKEIANNSLKIK